MDLIELNINKILLLEKYNFKNAYNNIDFLNAQAVLSKNLDQQLYLLNLATHKIERFHSFFHFEQSYFHLQLALTLLQNKKEQEAKKQLEYAIFQDHCNDQAIAMLNGTTYIKEYNRIYPNYSDYLSFATDEQTKTTQTEGYWQDYLNYRKNLQEKILIEIINKIKQHHLSYHIEAAKLYLNRAIVFFFQKQVDLAKNDLRKAFYLDSKIKTKEYYLPIEKLIFFTT